MLLFDFVECDFGVRRPGAALARDGEHRFVELRLLRPSPAARYRKPKRRQGAALQSLYFKEAHLAQFTILARAKRMPTSETCQGQSNELRILKGGF
jgi:hypothetical protein